MLVIAFLPRSKYLLISWLWSLSAVILEPKKIVCYCLHFFPICLPWSRRRRGRQRMRWLDGITDLMDMNLSELFESWWWTGRPGVLRFMGSQRVGYDWATELNSVGLDAMILVFWMLSFKPAFSLSSLTLIKRLFSSSSFKIFSFLSLPIVTF